MHRTSEVRALQELVGWYLERACQREERTQTQVPLAALDAAHVRSVKPAEVSEFVLRKANVLAAAAKDRAKLAEGRFKFRNS
jgi:hypothetical protein